MICADRRTGTKIFSLVEKTTGDSSDVLFVIEFMILRGGGGVGPGESCYQGPRGFGDSHIMQGGTETQKNTQ